jgi:hypothetical protein
LKNISHEDEALGTKCGEVWLHLGFFGQPPPRHQKHVMGMEILRNVKRGASLSLKMLYNLMALKKILE